MASRKRRAPGASPQVQQSGGLQSRGYTQGSGNIATDQYMSGWNDPSLTNNMSSEFDPSLFSGIDFSATMGGGPGQSSHGRIVSLDGTDSPNADAGAYSGSLVRRNTNQQIAARRPTNWDAFNSNATTVQQGGWENAEDDDEELEQKALLAKKDAQSKRKQIPPFVQKLSSFLDEKNNTNLIRWSDDGNSFIVLDEDEFARTLIPELFKHNNYASFVRQLNMYGFHKKVGLSDNSMKASETKAKAPSEYFNKYFKRGRPELLWLIQKPKNTPAHPKRKRDDDKQGDSDEERKYLPDAEGGNYAEDGLAVRANEGMAMIPRTEYNSLRKEVHALQQQQRVISNVLNQIRRQNEQLYQQAQSFQTLHERHENSINAILTFLATFYNRSLEGNSGANIADMFGAAIPQPQPHGNVVDVGDYPETTISTASPALNRPARRRLALLPAPTPKDVKVNPPLERAQTLAPSVRESAATTPMSKPAARPNAFKPSAAQPKPASPAAAGFANQPTTGDASAASVKIEADSPQNLGPLSENDVMSAIQSVHANATTQGPQFDFPAALSNYQTQGGNVPLTAQQRNDVLSLMVNKASAASPNSAVAQNRNNALVSPQPPPMPSLEQFQATQAQLEMLQKMSEQQNERVHNLQERLQPLSPSGTIPGLGNDSYFGNAPLGEPGQYDLNDINFDSLIQDNDYFPDATNRNPDGLNPADVNLPDLSFENTGLPNGAFGAEAGDDFPFDVANDDADSEGGGRIERVSSSATSPSATVKDTDEETSSKKRSPKRRKMTARKDTGTE